MERAIHTERLTLTIVEPKDAVAMVGYYKDNRAHLAPWDPPHPEGFYTLEFWLKQLRQSSDEFVVGRSARFAVRLKDEPGGPIIGRCNFSNVVRGCFHSCYLGYSLDHRHVGRGFMTEALRAAVGFAFERLHLHRIQANYIPTNERSGAVLKRLGFTVEGFARDYLFINGAWRDHIMTALINPDMEGLPVPRSRV